MFGRERGRVHWTERVGAAGSGAERGAEGLSKEESGNEESMPEGGTEAVRMVGSSEEGEEGGDGRGERMLGTLILRHG